jgi:hypothetical protein
MGSKHLLEAGKAIYVKAGRARKRREKARKVAERKIRSMHLLKGARLDTKAA